MAQNGQSTLQKRKSLSAGQLSPQAKAKARQEAMALSPHPRPRGAGPRFGTVPFSLARATSRHGQVTAVSMMKDEGPFVLEWVAHHLALGFTDLVVYTNDCSDGTDDMLIRLEELGLVHHRRNDIPEGIRPQPSALNYAQQEPVVCLSDWVMVFDADEFLSIRYGDGGLEGLLDAAVAQEANGIVVTWRIFGSGGVTEWSRAPVTEQYLHAAPPDWNKGWGVKTLFKFDPEAWKLGIHRPKMKSKVLKTAFPDGVKWLNGSGRVMEEYFKFRGWRSITRTIGYDWVQLNHYAVKSVDSYALRKLRGNVNNKKDKYNSDYWSLQDRNEVRDDTMLRYSARRAEVMGHLLSDKVLAGLHAAALARVEARLDELRPTPAYQALREDLARASQVPITQIVAKPPQARDPQKIAALMSEVEKLRTTEAKAARQSAGQAAKRAAKAEGDLAPPPPIALGAQRPPLTAIYAQPLLPNPAFQGDWAENHGILLPCDPGLFAPPTLASVAKGKFERGLARLLPNLLPQGGKVLELGAGLGFLSFYLAKLRPDLRIYLDEGEAPLRGLWPAILAKNGLGFGPHLKALSGDSAPDPAVIWDQMGGCDALILGDPRLLAAPSALATLLAQPSRLVIATARSFEGSPQGREALGAQIAAAGYQPDPRLNSETVLAFKRP